MSFILPDLVIESLIRDGLENARRDDSVIEDVFCELTRPHIKKKYGQKEINKITKLMAEEEVSVVHAFNLVNANLPCFSIQLADDREAEDRAHMGNYVQNRTVPITDPDRLAALTVVSSFQPTTYSPNSGAVKVPDIIDLEVVHANQIFVDADGNEFQILGPISNVNGNKKFFIEKQQTVNLGPGAEIKGSIDYDVYIEQGNIEQTQLIIGVHTQDPLTTKYLYTLLKYFIASRKKDAIPRGLQINTYTGSDFNRNMNYVGDTVFTRFLNVSCMVQHQWRSDKVQLIENVEVQVLVAKDKASNEQLGLEDSTVKQVE